VEIGYSLSGEEHAPRDHAGFFAFYENEVLGVAAARDMEATRR
jgi:hypothetical protein